MVIQIKCRKWRKSRGNVYFLKKKLLEPKKRWQDFKFDYILLQNIFGRKICEKSHKMFCYFFLNNFFKCIL